MKKNTNYEAPQLTVVEFRMERGFATSTLSVWSAQQRIQTFVDQQMIEAQDNDGQGNLVGGYMTGTEDHSTPIGGSGWEYENGGWF